MFELMSKLYNFYPWCDLYDITLPPLSETCSYPSQIIGLHFLCGQVSIAPFAFLYHDGIEAGSLIIFKEFYYQINLEKTISLEVSRHSFT